MFKYSVSGVVYSLLACAPLYCPHAARAGSLPTVTITSATGSAFWGNTYSGTCQGICAGLSSPIFTLGAGGDFQPAPYFQAVPGHPGMPLALAIFVGPPLDVSGSVFFGGIDYPVVYQEVVVTPAPFIVPYDGTVEVPAVLTGSGTACTAIYLLYPGGTFQCFANSPTTPPPVMIANVDLDIPGYLTFTSYKAPDIAPSVEYTAIFTPVPEPSTVLLVLPALALFWAKRKA